MLWGVCACRPFRTIYTERRPHKYSLKYYTTMVIKLYTQLHRVNEMDQEIHFQPSKQRDKMLERSHFLATFNL